MTAEHFTAVLAERVLHWRSTPDRLLTGKRAWIPRWRSQPLANLAAVIAVATARMIGINVPDELSEACQE